MELARQLEEAPSSSSSLVRESAEPFLSIITTVEPSDRKRCAISFPMPDAAPVTYTTSRLTSFLNAPGTRILAKALATVSGSLTRRM